MPTNHWNRRMKTLHKRIKNADISEENRKLLWEFKRDLEVQDYSKGRIYKLLNYLKIIGEHIDYNFEEASEEDIKDTVAWLNRRDVSDATKCDTRTILKRFYKWIGNGEYPDEVKWINTTVKRANNTLPKDMLIEKDVQKLIEAAYNTRDKAIISMLWETGARIGELIDLNISDLEDHKLGKKVVIQGKTGTRRIPLISSVPHLQAWLNNHPRAYERNAPLWVNLGTRNPGKKAEYRAIRKMLDEVAERAGIDKPVNPHHFRHSRATYLASGLSNHSYVNGSGEYKEATGPPTTFIYPGETSTRTTPGSTGYKTNKTRKNHNSRQKNAPGVTPRKLPVQSSARTAVKPAPLKPTKR